jgi:hypothetical protein
MASKSRRQRRNHTEHTSRETAAQRAHPSLRTRQAEQEHLVVHGQPEQHREQEQRQPRLDGVDLLEAEQARADTALEHQHQQPVGGSDRQEIERHPQQRQHHRAEHHQQQHER